MGGKDSLWDFYKIGDLSTEKKEEYMKVIKMMEIRDKARKIRRKAENQMIKLIFITQH